MPYASNDQLPPPVRNHLPPAAQDIYRETTTGVRASSRLLARPTACRH